MTNGAYGLWAMPEYFVPELGFSQLYPIWRYFPTNGRVLLKLRLYHSQRRHARSATIFSAKYNERNESVHRWWPEKHKETLHISITTRHARDSYVPKRSGSKFFFFFSGITPMDRTATVSPKWSNLYETQLVWWTWSWQPKQSTERRWYRCAVAFQQT